MIYELFPSPSNALWAMWFAPQAASNGCRFATTKKAGRSPLWIDSGKTKQAVLALVPFQTREARAFPSVPNGCSAWGKPFSEDNSELCANVQSGNDYESSNRLFDSTRDRATLKDAFETLSPVW